MDKTGIRNQIMESDEFVLAEIHKIRTLYTLKKEVRYGHDREIEAHTESVAEHIYALHCLIDYFLPLENPENNWDREKIHFMAQYHDIDEIETGDTVSHLKTDEEETNELQAANKVIAELPALMQNEIRAKLEEFHEQKTPEAKFVKMVDKIEPVFHVFDEDGKKTLNNMKFTKEMYEYGKKIHIEDYPGAMRFYDVALNYFIQNGFITTGRDKI